ILVIVDEVQAGFGRTGRFWGHQHADLTPDILITAKGLASGFPISAIAAPTELMSRAWPGSQGGTYGGNAVAAAAAIATLDVIDDEGLVENARVRGEQLLSGIRDVTAAFDVVGDVRGLGLMVGIEFVSHDGNTTIPDAATALAVQQATTRHGLLTLTCGPEGNVVRLIPALVVTEDEITTGVARFASALADVAARNGRS
ncbi:aminotransferase class III-fold pyridoxal phosphate-dependent enzyme, partial [Gordonia aichiensis]